jgi:hypothetical protein
MSSTLYDILEVIPTASQETIHAAYRSLINRFHPDKVAGLGEEFQTIADARTKEINHAYDILGDAARRARYDEELRREEDSPRFLPTPKSAPPKSPPPRSQAAHPKKSPVTATGAPATGPSVEGRHAFATLSAAVAGIALVLTLPLAANVIFGAVEFSLTGHARYFYEADNPIDAKDGDSNSAYLLILWGWLFANYLFGLVSYRLAIAAGEMAAARGGGSFAATNDRLFLFLTFVCVVATGQLLFSAHTMGNMLAGMFILAGAYLSERGIG